MDLAQRLVVALGADRVEEIDGGHQSRVFWVIGHDGRRQAVAKVLDATMVDRDELELRVEIIAALADRDSRVRRPLLVAGRRVTELTVANGQHHIVCYELAVGTEPDPASGADAARMGAALSELHVSMSRLPATALPVVSALRAVAADEVPAGGPHQLLHGDFSPSNLRQSGDVVRIFDLDDCGYGPPAFDVANTLYMVLFDGVTQATMETYETFRPSFVDGYAAGPGPPLFEGVLDRFIDLRVRALGSWLDDLDRAPIGIRTASPTWQATLRSFVASHRPVTP